MNGPKPPSRRRGLKDRFVDKVKKLSVELVMGIGPCWEWQGNCHPTAGYGTIRARGKTAWTHRVSWELYRGPVPAGKMVLHTCDNRRCVRPDHLFLGTHADNMKDMDQKGRRATGQRLASHGALNGNAKLTQEQIDAIKKNAGGLSSQALADQYGVHRSQIWRIQRAKVWLTNDSPKEIEIDDQDLSSTRSLSDAARGGNARGNEGRLPPA